MDGKRQLCVKEYFSQPRKLERIPVICDLIEELWERYRLNNLSINFFQLLDLIDLSARGKENVDTFYWEDDKWYDFLQGLIGSSKKLEQNNLLENVMDMQEITNCFKEYWVMYPDYRFKQILDVFNITIDKDKKMLENIDSIIWRKFFMEKRMDILQGQIEMGTKKLEELTLWKKNKNILVDDNLLDISKQFIKIKQKELDNLKEEYKNGFEL